MQRALRRTLAAGVLVAALGPALAQDHLRMRSGKLLTGRVVSYDREARVVAFATQDGEQLQLPVKDLDRLSAYKLAKSKAKKDDPRNELLLGNFARDIELYAHAGRHYQKAVDLDPGLAGEVETARVQLRKEAADYCMRQADEAIARKDTQEAEKWLTTLVEKLPGEPQAQRAATLLADYYARNHAAKDDELERNHDELLRKELKAGKRHYDLMLRNIQRGLTNPRSTSGARKSLETAWRDGEKAIREIDKVKKAYGEDPMVDNALESYRNLVHEHMISTALHLASLLTTRTSHMEAQQWVNKALAIDPKNREALSARARIEVAASQGWGWGWNGR